jgi:type I restriction enzyme S subunit
MDEQTFFENFAHFADAPNGVQKLRDLILQLAVQGKLVPQDPKDEPASKLLERIRAEKARLVKEKVIRKSDPLPPVKADEALCELPQGWEWVRFGDLGRILGGGTPSSDNPEYFTASGIPWLTPADLYGFKSKYISHGRRDLSELGLSKSSAQLMPAGSVVFSSRAPIGYVAISQNPISTNQGFKSCVPYLLEMKEYIYWFLKSAAEEIDRNASGTTFKEVSGKIVSNILISIPPLPEQHRIVAKVDQLMALCDELEAKQQRTRTKLTRLNNAALDRLTSARDDDDFTPAWELVRDNFDLLYTTPETIAKLRQSILELAVQGKLIAPTNRDHWKQGVLGDVVESSEAGWSPQCENRPRIGNEWGVLKVSAVSWDHFKPAENKALPPHLDARPEYEVKSGDFLISRANTSELVAKSVVVNDSPHRLSLSDKTVRLHFRADASPRYFCLVNNSPASRDYYAGNAGGTSSSMKNVTRKQILALPVLIPPLSEQHRIVAKVDQLMTLCDGLETRLTKAQAKAEKLTTATIQGLLAA